MRFNIAPLIVLALVACGTVTAEGPPPRCADEKSHEFDFWIGEWDVVANGKAAGTNSIKPILDGCVLQETWSGAGGGAGSSFNFYDPAGKRWRQFWVWRNGTTLELAGKFVDGKMILSGRSKNPEGKSIDNRITWYDNADKTVRQVWEQSVDGGKSWKTVFDGTYTRR